jgi:hypothetical protein
MTALQFVYWLQGFLEISERERANMPFTEKQVECVKEHIALV